MESTPELRRKKPSLLLRGRLFQSLRDFFRTHGFDEVETPVRIPAPAPEPHIEAPAVACGGFLRTSPELEMKQLLAAGYDKIFQIGPCFREGEIGSRHAEEFTMLEFYAVGWNDRELLRFTFDLLADAAAHFSDGAYDFSGYDTLSVDEAFCRYAGCSAEAAIANDTFDELLVTKIEPHLGMERPLFLTDYPAALAAFARLNPANPAVSERWELYLRGMELANAYGELVDPEEQKRRFAQNAAIRASYGGKPYPDAHGFLAALSDGIPPSAGCAIGLDRLLMHFTKADRIDSVRFI